MADYISREAAIEAISGTCATCGGKGIFCGENDCSTGNHRAKLRAVPAADVRPVVRGHWIDISRSVIAAFRCDKCGEETVDTYMGKPIDNFCPNCGAEMRPEKATEDETIVEAEVET